MTSDQHTGTAPPVGVATGVDDLPVDPTAPPEQLTRVELRELRELRRSGGDSPAIAPTPGADPVVDAAHPTAGDGAARLRHRLGILARISGYYLASRLAVGFAVLVVKWLFPTFNIVRSLGAGWDGGWYTRIAQFGYPHSLLHEVGGSRWGFFPALPAAERAVVEISGITYPDAGIVVAVVFGWMSAVAVWLAVREVFGPDVADRSVILYLFFPISVVLSMGYTEGLFIAASAFCIFALSREYWLSAAGFAVVASLTRSFGIVPVIAVVVVCALALRRPPRGRPILAILIAPLGVAGWAAYSWRLTGTPLAFIKAQRYWGNGHFVWFTTPFNSIRHLATGRHAWSVAPDVLASIALVVMFVGFALLVVAHRSGVRLPTGWWIYAVLTILAAMSPFWPSAILRYSLAAFPVYAALAWRIRDTWFITLVGVCALAQGALAVMLLAGLVYPQATLLSP